MKRCNTVNCRRKLRRNMDFYKLRHKLLYNMSDLFGCHRNRPYRKKLSCGFFICRVRLKTVAIISLVLLLVYNIHLIQNRASISRALSIKFRTNELKIADDKKSNNKVILFWTSFFEWPNFGVGFGQKPFIDMQCLQNNCETTNDRKRLEEADAVIFHVRDLNPANLPAIRYQDQRWVFYLYEQPQLTWLDLRSLGHLFNWTMTYRRDSDIPMMTFNSIVRDHIVTETNIDYSMGKSKLVAWLVSNCYHAFSHRDRYVADLQKFMQVDIIGGCGWKMPGCYPKGDYRKCYQLLEKDYKFYLSFENAICKDYFTEKWVNVVNYNMIPIVMGGADYKAFAPPHSFIDVNDFKSPRKLAEYLLSVDANDTLYNEYFEWKRQYVVRESTKPFCELCKMLHDDSLPPKSYDNIHQWWVEKGNCSGVFELPPNELSITTKYFDYVVDSLIFWFGTWIYGILARFWF